MTSQPVTRVSVLPRRHLPHRQCPVCHYLQQPAHVRPGVHAGFSIASTQLEVGGSAADCQVTARIAASSFASGKAKHDNDAKGPGLLDVAGFPLIGFSSTDMRKAEHGLALGGSVAMHGVTIPVQFLVSAWKASAPDGTRVFARAEHLDRQAFGITGAKGWVGRYFDLDFFMAAARTGTH